MDVFIGLLFRTFIIYEFVRIKEDHEHEVKLFHSSISIFKVLTDVDDSDHSEELGAIECDVGSFRCTIK